MADVDPVVLRLIADVQRYQNDLRVTTRVVEDQINRQERTIRDLERQIRSSTGSISGSLKAMAGSFAAYFSTQEVGRLIDEFTRFQNSLRVAGLEGQQLAGVQSQLLALSGQYGVSLGALGNLFGNASQSGKELGATQEQILALTKATSQSLLITGTTTEQASGAILGLAQALGNAKLQAEEYNQINDGGLRPLLQAAANTERFAGSIGRLRAAVLNQEVTSKDFFNLILEGSASLEGQASKATLTLAGAFTALQSQLVIYVGGAASANGVTAGLSAGIKALADNIDIIIPALAVVGTALAVGLVTSAVAGSNALFALQARIAGAATTAEAAAFAFGTAGRSILAAFGGGIGLAITGLTLAVGALVVDGYKADQLGKDVGATYERLSKQMDAAAAGAKAAAGGTATLGNDALGAIPKVNSFAGAVGNLAQQLYNQARAARVARIEQLQTELQTSQAQQRSAQQRTAAGREASRGGFFSALGRGDVLTAGGIFGRNFASSTRSVLSGGRTDREAERTAQLAGQNNQILQQQIRQLQTTPITAEASAINAQNTVDAKAIARHEETLKGLRKRLASAKGKEVQAVQRRITREEAIIAELQKGSSNTEATAAAPGTGGGGGRSAESIAKENERKAKEARERQQRIEAQIADAQVGYLSELANTTRNAAERAEIEQQVIEATRVANETDIRNNEDLDAAQRKQLTELNNLTAALRSQQVREQEVDRLRQQQLVITQQALRSEDDLLQLQSRLAQTRSEQRRIELRRLEIAQNLERGAIAEELAQAQIANDTARIAAARKRLADLEARGGLEREGILRDTETPGQRYIRNINAVGRDINSAAETAATDGLDALNDGLADAITGAKSLGDVFSDVSTQIIRDLLRIAIQQSVIKPLANSLFGEGSSGIGGGGGLFGRLLGGAASIFGGGGPNAGVTAAFGTGAAGIVAGDGANGTPSLASIFSRLPGRASGGYVSPGELYRVNEGAGLGKVEAFRPAGAGHVIPLGQVASRPQGGGLTIKPIINVDARGVNPTGFADGIKEGIRGEIAELLKAYDKGARAGLPALIQKNQQLR